MQAVVDFWRAYQSTLAFAIVNAFFGLSTYAVLSAGILSFASVTYAAIGGFVGARLVLQTGIDPLIALPVAAAAGALLAYVIALIFLRLESHWMALASLALILITRVVVINVPGVTGGVNGLSVPVGVSLGVLVILLAVAVAVFWRLSVSWYGIAARAVREDPAVASSLGIAPRRIQTIAFVISGAVGGLGGMLLALVLQFLSPDTYFVNIAFTMIAAVVLGGSYHWVGAIIGAAVFTALPVIAQAVIPAFQEVANGVVLLLIMIFLPRGLVDPRAIRLRRAARTSGDAS
ncbi:leucine/isoleucine/valine transporter permease subunit (plasmid) [Variovorax sp. SRS16]|uniref:branched-chain amino acid ABC transporter permease n=1 Tax=Variovorax sp. SRS16 TaxID=282217 RepID=UPI001318804E|nr:branched-chain amino acid ABC transporter permease [Variovorax sp. SRS16]VTU46524.1 leucine/isoleucine/valine transporter permease subunit [Variovorax sp. SRS16]